ncbi:MAG: HDOD domain-containing protein, partial [Aureliella sp.]
NWKLPEEFATLIERHPNLYELLSVDPPQRDAACVALASLLPACRDEQWTERDEFLDGLTRLSPQATEKIEEILAEADSTFAEFAPTMKIAIPDYSLIQWYSAQ